MAENINGKEWENTSEEVSDEIRLFKEETLENIYKILIKNFNFYISNIETELKKSEDAPENEFVDNNMSEDTKFQYIKNLYRFMKKLRFVEDSYEKHAFNMIMKDVEFDNDDDSYNFESSVLNIIKKEKEEKKYTNEMEAIKHLLRGYAILFDDIKKNAIYYFEEKKNEAIEIIRIHKILQKYYKN